MTNKHWAVEAKETEELIAEKLALLTLKGVGLNAAVTLLKPEANFDLTRTKLITLKRHPRYHEVIRKDAEARIETGTLEARLGCIELVPDCLAALKQQIKKGNVKAIETALKTAVGDKKQDTSEQVQAIQIIMATDTPVKDVKPIK